MVVIFSFIILFSAKAETGMLADQRQFTKSIRSNSSEKSQIHLGIPKHLVMFLCSHGGGEEDSNNTVFIVL